MMARFEKHFSLDEANEILPHVQRVFGAVHGLLRGDSLPGFEDEAADSFYHPDRSKPVRRLEDGDRQKVASELLQIEILDRGIVVQDVWRGLIDFPHLIGADNEVLLCYELNDGERILAFHDLDSGFMGRRPIEELGAG